MVVINCYCRQTGKIDVKIFKTIFVACIIFLTACLGIYINSVRQQLDANAAKLEQRRVKIENYGWLTVVDWKEWGDKDEMTMYMLTADDVRDRHYLVVEYYYPAPQKGDRVKLSVNEDNHIYIKLHESAN